MPSLPVIRNIGSYCTTTLGMAAAAAATVGTTNGTSVDRLTAVSGSPGAANLESEPALSGKFAVSLTTAAIDASNDASITLAVQDSADGSTWAAYAGTVTDGFETATTLAVAAIDGSIYDNATFNLELDVDLTGAREFIRATLVSADTQGTATTIAINSGVWVLGLGSQVPAGV